MEITEATTVAAPPERVWELISDPRNAPCFNPMVQRVTNLQEQPDGGIGTRWKAVANMAGQMEIASEITEWDPPHRLAIAMDGPARGVLTFVLTPDADGTTRVEQRATSDLPALTAPLVKPMLEQNLRESLQRIKAQMEGGHA